MLRRPSFYVALAAVLAAVAVALLWPRDLPQRPPEAPSEERDFFGFRIPVGPPVLAGRSRYAIVPERSIAGFDATSTLHNFSGWTRAVTGWVEMNGRAVRGEVVVDARKLATGDAGRDRDMHETYLETASHPEIRFTLENVGEAEVAGTMAIHGHAKRVRVPVSYRVREDGWLHVEGRFPSRMTDFGIPPPVRFGVLRVGDEISIWFEFWAEPRKEPVS
jgi:polyisoprenoid-binding protein YceI